MESPTPASAPMLSGTPLQRASTAEQVAAALRQQLLQGEVAPGTKLRDQLIAAALGVSRNTVREAMVILAAEGLLQRNLHKGAVVAELGLEELADVYQARRALELSGLQFAAAASDDGWLDDLRRALADMDAAAADDDVQALLDADRRFHEAIIRPIGSQRVFRFHQLVQTEIRLTRAWHGARMPAPAFVARHAEIVAALVGSDFKLGGELLHRLIDDGQHRLREQLSESQQA
jgi:DNA-binding GntR family transcriptional regulator